MFEKLLVPLDGSAQAAVALPLARALAQQTGAAVRLLRVMPPPGSGATDQGGIDAKTNLSEIAAELTDGGVRVDTGVRPDDDPGAALRQAHGREESRQAGPDHRDVSAGHRCRGSFRPCCRARASPNGTRP